MKPNVIALSTFCFIGLTLSVASSPILANSSPIHQDATKGDQGHEHHDHSTPQRSESPEVEPSEMTTSNAEISAPTPETSSDVNKPDMPNESHQDMHGESHGGASSHEAHQGGVHGEHGGMNSTVPWLHHGAVEVSEVFHLSMGIAENGTEDLSGASMDMSAMTMPSVTVIVHPDARKGWNLEVQTEHFTFTPEQVNDVNQPNVGHGHLYVNGEKITRLYSNWFYLDHLDAGTNEITVSLHANGHEVWTHEGEAIAHTTTIEVQ